MSLREHDASAHPTPSPAPGQPLTRREARELEAAQAAQASQPSTALRPRDRAQAPKRAASRTALVPRAPRPVREAVAPRPTHSGPRKLLSLGALLFAGALLVGMSVPANAFMSGDGLLPSASSTKAPGQSVAVSADALQAAPVRDEFQAISYAEQLRQTYGNVSYAFTATTGAIRWPFPYAVTITDGFGPRAANISGSAFHNGVDFTPGGGTPIYAIADGVVSVHAEDQWGFGNHVIIQHDIPGQNIESLYAHMVYGSSPLKVGDVVKVGDFIGLVGDTGNSYGAHLHFELHVDRVPVDPFVWLSNNAVN